MSQEEDRQAELYAAFEALGGQLTWDELTRLLGSDEYRPALVWQVMLLLGGDAAAAEEVVQASFAALQDARSQLSGPEQARLWLYRAVVSRARSVRRHQGVSGEAGHHAVLALPHRQREALVLHTYMGLSTEQAAQVMGISTGAARSHLAAAMFSLRQTSRLRPEPSRKRGRHRCGVRELAHDGRRRRLRAASVACPWEGCLLELFSKTRDRNITNPAISTAAKKPVKPTTTKPITGFPPDSISSAPVNTMLAPVPAAATRAIVLGAGTLSDSRAGSSGWAAIGPAGMSVVIAARSA
jgi:DNA-directed RNA polymerase specialized sigma24 family protein